MVTNEVISAISDDFSSTFTLIDNQTITNIFSKADCSEVERIIKRHIPNVEAKFFRTGHLSSDPEGRDVWIIRINPA